MELLIIEADDPARMFAEFGSFRDPFDVWFRAVLADVYGLDLTQPPPGPPPKQLLDWSTEARACRARAGTRSLEDVTAGHRRTPRYGMINMRDSPPTRGATCWRVDPVHRRGGG